MTTKTSDAHADRETEAAIRKRIAEEVKGEINRMDAFWGPQVNQYFQWGYSRGMYCVLGIIERGTGVAGEGEG